MLSVSRWDIFQPGDYRRLINRKSGNGIERSAWLTIRGHYVRSTIGKPGERPVGLRALLYETGVDVILCWNRSKKYGMFNRVGTLSNNLLVVVESRLIQHFCAASAMWDGIHIHEPGDDLRDRALLYEQPHTRNFPERVALQDIPGASSG